MKMPEFQSCLASSLHGFVELRQSLGFADKGVVCHLAHFDRFLVARGACEKWLTRERVEEWVSSDGPLKPASRASRLHTMRILGRFIAWTHAKSYIPGPSWGPRSVSRFRPHIYTETELRCLLQEALKLGPTGSLRPKTYYTLLALLLTTGLRISEALELKLWDVDFQNEVLIVHESKFHKSRAVPLHSSAAQGLLGYRRERDARGNCVDQDAALFVNEWKRPLSYPVVNAVFLQLVRQAGIRQPAGKPGPRLHDLRHTFAVFRLLEWYRDGGNVQARLPLLATYLGHVSLVSTPVSLDITAELLHEAARRFQPPVLRSCSQGANP